MTVHADPQALAADPAVSAFVTANAGSGKTKTLIDRVARLLLEGAEPEAILCVTYTKAAAAEMQRRLFGRLGGWSVCSDAELQGELAKLEGGDPHSYDAAALSKARALFARALETPGGLKIQTIHAFCEKLLRRFPLEAGVSPGFTVMDDSASAAVADAARKAVAKLAMTGRSALADAYARLSVALDFNSFQQMFRTFEDRRGALRRFFEREGGFEGAREWVWNACGVGPGYEVEAIEAEAMTKLDRDLWLAVAAMLDGGGKSDQSNAMFLRTVARDAEASLDNALEVLFTEGGAGTPRTWPAKTAALKAREDLRGAFLEEQIRLEDARALRGAAKVAEDTIHVLYLAFAYLEAYRIEKGALGALDFADLIEKTRDLVASRPMAAWVLYKLDGGIDHVLVDEAQDTAPEQWEIIGALTAEFFAGAGAPRRHALSDLMRSIFVVGDEKQSIYSFQGADPQRLLIETDGFLKRIAEAGAVGRRAPLLASWRSTVEVLAFVDAVFEAPETRRGVPPASGDELVKHIAMRAGHRGCVDLWPLAREPKGEEREAWTAPLDAEPELSANRQLAERIAAEIQALVARGDAVFDKDVMGPDGRPGAWRPASYGDVLILVRRRKALFEEILRALKHRKVPVAGADRLALSEHILFDDLMALARFALFPRDDLTLAAVLRSPFCDVDEASLYALAKPRGKRPLWDDLTARAAERPEWSAASALLGDVLAEAKAQRPFEFYSRLLGRRDGEGLSQRARLLRRLGSEAEDALDEFLAQILAAEARGIEDLESLTAAFASLDITVKREMEAARDEVRVMTAHGSKGLEAPIVFVPETTLESGARGSPLLETEDGGFLWCASGKGDCEGSAAAREMRARKEVEEGQRLLYVALTRARDRLVLCGRIAANRREEGLKGWWALISSAFEHGEIAPQVREVTSGDIAFRRYGPDPEQLGRRAAPTTAASAALPSWADVGVEAEAFARYASPSDLGEGAKAAAASPLAQSAGLGRFRRGDLIHRLLQILPDLPHGERPDAALRLLARERDLTDAQRAEMIAAALGVLSDARFGEVFGPGGRAEVAIAGTAAALPKGLAISGRIDRLVVLDDRVLVVDFKTNRPSPQAIEGADPAYLRQMALYTAVLAEIFPGRRVEAALVWTDGPKLMPIPEILLAQTLAQLGREG